MTDNEIIKALECCSLINSEACNDCPLFINRKKECLCVDKLMRGALDLINRQKVEIERLQSMNQAKIDMIHDLRERLGE